MQSALGAVIKGAPMNSPKSFRICVQPRNFIDHNANGIRVYSIFEYMHVAQYNAN